MQRRWPYHVLGIIVVLIWGVTFVNSKVLLNHGMQAHEIFFVRFLWRMPASGPSRPIGYGLTTSPTKPAHGRAGHHRWLALFRHGEYGRENWLCQQCVSHRLHSPAAHYPAGPALSQGCQGFTSARHGVDSGHCRRVTGRLQRSYLSEDQPTGRRTGHLCCTLLGHLQHSACAP